MTRIDANAPSGAAAEARAAADRRFDAADARRRDRDDGGGLDPRRPGADLFGTKDGFAPGGRFDEREREAAFAERVRHAIEDGREAGGGADAAADAATLRLLASVERLPALPVPGVSSIEPSGGTAGTRAEEIADRVEASIRAADRPAPGQPLMLRLALGDVPAAEGISAIAVTMTADGLDVTLTRDGGEASQSFVQAAQALAERLQQRFSRRLVRVFEVDAPAPGRDDARSDALGELSALLGAGARR
jgi:hypothetical protein